ncbi:N-acetylmuramoyl-L-alanine amidase [Paenalkalicoccus suaedae]|uniref:Autolysin n=1 Tax=Paenalkalicoccus suaedae TaxID=2592382 RepID=A0A859FCT4_9BACI|nr:N-acetylmuramoyl-L-alanine amidase [Paenalkalicoccus suaedae]QKS70648.1 N-acetylmuramoyl-L-alanine amidase [Paenalkalicoccus suaedae]
MGEFILCEDKRSVLARGRGTYKRQTAWNMITIHHSATDEGSAASFANHHVRFNKWPGIGYHYVILRDGTIEWSLGVENVGIHTRLHNTYNIGICLVGNGSFTTQQTDVLTLLVKILQIRYSIKHVKGHKDHANQQTVCPGLPVSKLVGKVPILKLSSKGILVRHLQYFVGGLTVDGVFGPRTESGVKAFQGKRNLMQDGIVGPLTWRALM